MTTQFDENRSMTAMGYDRLGGLANIEAEDSQFDRRRTQYDPTAPRGE